MAHSDSLAIILRPATEDDTPALVDVVNADSLETLGTRRAIIDTRGQPRFARYIPPSAERMIVTAPGGEIAGVLYLRSAAPFIAHEIGGAVHPRYRHHGIGDKLMAWAEGRAAELQPQAPPGARVVAQYNVFECDVHTRTLLEARGYRRVREWIHLAIELTAQPPAPVWPDGIAVRQMDQSRDWPAVSAALEDAFADHWGQIPPSAIAQEQPDEPESPEMEDEEGEEDDPYSNSRDFCFVAMCGNVVAGSCLGNARTVEWPDSGKVGSLSIRRPYRRRGIGRALMLHAFRAFYDRGIRRVITDTDADSFTGSGRLYLGLGMRIYRREYLYEKDVRPGRELRVLAPEDLAASTSS